MKNINIAKLAGVALTALMGTQAMETAAQVKLHTIGDSTMQTYEETQDKRGWGQMLQQFFDAASITVNNRGKSGASSKSFYKEAAYWPTMVTGAGKIAEGDFVVIQFAHNDEKCAGVDGDELIAYYKENEMNVEVDYRGTSPSDTYKSYLRKYIEETKALGGKPILVGPICRKYFSGNSISRAGRHDLGDKFDLIKNDELLTNLKVGADDHSMDYVYQMKEVAAEYADVPFLDLTTKTAELYLSYGDAYCTANLFVSDDKTHTVAMGATLVARTFAQLLKEQAEGGETDATKRAVLQALAQHVVLASDINISPANGDMGKIYFGQTTVREFNISAFDITPAEGTLSVTAEGDFEVSTDKTTFGKSATLTYSGANVIAPIYVKCLAQTEGNNVGKVSIGNGNISKSIDLSAEVIKLEGGVPVQAVWELSTDANATIAGPIIAMDETWAGMGIEGYKAINSAALWPTESGYDATRKTQRNLIEGSTWPANEIDEVSTRYIQFAVKAPEGYTLSISKLSLYVAGAGGSGMCCKVYYSTDPTFSTNSQVCEMKKMAGNTAKLVEAAPVTEISGEQTFYVRIYPWYSNSSAVSGKTICLTDVTIAGMAMASGPQSESASISLGSAKEIESVTYYSTNGAKMPQQTRGVNIMRTTFADGSQKVQKVIK